MKNIIKIDIENAETDMQVASDVLDKQGVCLLTTGSVLTSSLISSLKKRDIKNIYIYEYVALTEEQANSLIMNINKELDYSFSHLGNFQLLNDLKQVFLDFRVREITNNNE